MAAKQIQNNINSVTISYNGKQNEFNKFLESIIKNYVFNNDISVYENNIYISWTLKKSCDNVCLRKE